MLLLTVNESLKQTLIGLQAARWRSSDVIIGLSTPPKKSPERKQQSSYTVSNMDLKKKKKAFNVTASSVMEKLSFGRRPVT